MKNNLHHGITSISLHLDSVAYRWNPRQIMLKFYILQMEGKAGFGAAVTCVLLPLDKHRTGIKHCPQAGLQGLGMRQREFNILDLVFPPINLIQKLHLACTELHTLHGQPLGQGTETACTCSQTGITAVSIALDCGIKPFHFDIMHKPVAFHEGLNLNTCLDRGNSTQ